MGLNMDAIGTLVAFLLTLMVYAYLFKDIPSFYSIYRIAAYLFVGVALGYAAVMAWHGVIVPRLLLRLEQGHWWNLVPLVLCLLLLTKARPGWQIGNISIAFMLGVGAALAVGGGIVGTLIPQVKATFVSLNPLHYQARASLEGAVSPLVYVFEALLMVVGTISTLLYFYFHTEGGSQRLAALRDPILNLATGFGKVFMMFAFGTLFASIAMTCLSLLADRIRFLILTVWGWLPTL